MSNNLLVFIPTYNEAENVAHIYEEIKALGLDADILFLDDNSPDGTGNIIDELVQKNRDNTFVIHRTGKLGIGSAHQDGINWAYDKGYDILITMDCDFTHSPEYIRDFINGSANHDIVVGSRFIKEDSLNTWNIYRKALTHLGHFLTVLFLQMPYDASGAFRLYKLHNIDRTVFYLIRSKSYSFFFESLFILDFNKFRINEIPIHLPSRTYGHSKMEIKDIVNSLKFLGKIFSRKMLNKKSFLIRK